MQPPKSRTFVSLIHASVMLLHHVLARTVVGAGESPINAFFDRKCCSSLAELQQIASAESVCLFRNPRLRPAPFGFCPVLQQRQGQAACDVDTSASHRYFSRKSAKRVGSETQGKGARSRRHSVQCVLLLCRSFWAFNFTRAERAPPADPARFQVHWIESQHVLSV